MIKRSQTPGQIQTTLKEIRAGTWRANARQRAARRKSKWNLLLPILIFPPWLLLWWAGAELAWLAHLFFITDGSAPSAPWVLQGIGPRLGLPGILMLFPPLLPALSAAMAVGNFAIYLIPPARRALDLEAGDFPGTDYRSAQSALIKMTAVFLPIAAILALIGAAMFAR